MRVRIFSWEFGTETKTICVLKAVNRWHKLYIIYLSSNNSHHRKKILLCSIFLENCANGLDKPRSVGSVSPWKESWESKSKSFKNRMWKQLKFLRILSFSSWIQGMVARMSLSVLTWNSREGNEKIRMIRDLVTLRIWIHFSSAHTN
jgi:hypothetical protein